MAKQKATCPECGGRKFGRGFNHEPGCSLARPSGGARPGKRTRAGRKRSGLAADVARLSIDQLLEVRQVIDGELVSRRGDALRAIKELRALL